MCAPVGRGTASQAWGSLDCHPWSTSVAGTPRTSALGKEHVIERNIALSNVRSVNYLELIWSVHRY